MAVEVYEYSAAIINECSINLYIVLQLVHIFQVNNNIEKVLVVIGGNLVQNKPKE
jgi:hypothetical protein